DTFEITGGTRWRAEAVSVDGSPLPVPVAVENSSFCYLTLQEVEALSLYSWGREGGEAERDALTPAWRILCDGVVLETGGNVVRRFDLNCRLAEIPWLGFVYMMAWV